MISRRHRDQARQWLAEYGKYAAVAGAVAYFSWQFIAREASQTQTAVLCRRYARSVAQPRLFFKAGPLSKIVVERCPELLQPYYPAPLAHSPHAQTVLSVLRGLTIRGQFYREIRGMADGGCIALDWYKDSHVESHTSQTAPVVLVMHGLTGGSSEGYVKWMCHAVAERGWRAVVMNYRGCAGLPLTSTQCYNAVFTDDVHEAILHISGKFPSAPVFAVGYSLGALLLTKYTAEADSGRFGWQLDVPAASSRPSHSSGSQTAQTSERVAACGARSDKGSGTGPPDAPSSPCAAARAEYDGAAGAREDGWQPTRQGEHATTPWWRKNAMPRQWTGSGLAGAVMVSNPFCMSSACANLEKPWTMGWIYNLVLTHRLKEYMRTHQHQVARIPSISAQSVSEAMTLRQFDSAATCRTAGYDSPDSYYTDGSSQNFIPRIRTPSLFLVSDDDPFLGCATALLTQLLC